MLDPVTAVLELGYVLLLSPGMPVAVFYPEENSYIVTYIADMPCRT